MNDADLDKLTDRAKSVWPGGSNFVLSDVYKYESELNLRDSRKIWERIKLPTFVAPNLQIYRSGPIYISNIGLFEVGSDREDRKVFYMPANGFYFIPMEGDLKLFASSTEKFFNLLITYAEWIEKVIGKYGNDCYINMKFHKDDTVALEKSFHKILDTSYESSYWNIEVSRISSQL